MQSTARKRVRRAQRGLDPPSQLAVSGAAGRFELLTDDALVQILETLAALDPDCEGETWQRQRRSCTRDAMRLAATCRRLRAALRLNYCPDDGPLYAELLARKLTDVQPAARVRRGLRPYMTQLELERRSAAQLRALDVLDGQLGFHCSGKCCAHARMASNRRLREVSPARDQPYVAFGYDRSRRLVRLAGGDAEPRVACEEFQPRHRLVLLRASPDGGRVAWTGHNDGMHLQLWVWTPLTLAQHRSVVRQVEWQGDPPHPTAVWWTSDNRLCVAWTRTYVTPMGTDTTEGEAVEHDDRYVLATYDVCPDFGEVTLSEVWGESTAYERLVSVSPDASGTRVACLVRTRPYARLGAAMRTHYKVVVHAGDMRSELTHPQVWKGSGSSSDPGGIDWGPSAAGMSPAGDKIVVVHRAEREVLTEVFALNEGVLYSRINAHNLAEWMPMQPDKPHTGANAVKPRYAVGFSSCGRYATVTDQRARWKYEFTGHALVCLDLALCRVCRDIPVQLLCYSEEIDPDLGLSSRVSGPTPLRELHWGGDTVWILAGKGVIRITSSHGHIDPQAPPLVHAQRRDEHTRYPLP